MAPVSAPEDLIYLVRHARAGDRESWRGDDRLRPLTKGGRRQAEALVELLQEAPITSILSSPYQRCLETVAPVARYRGIPVETSVELGEGPDLAAVLVVLRRVAAGSVLCSHGDVILAVLEFLAGQGALRPAEVQAEKGSTWVLQRNNGQITHARYVRASV